MSQAMNVVELFTHMGGLVFKKWGMHHLVYGKQMNGVKKLQLYIKKSLCIYCVGSYGNVITRYVCSPAFTLYNFTDCSTNVVVWSLVVVVEIGYIIL